MGPSINRVYEYLRITWGTYSKLVALRVEKKTNLALGLSRVAYCPECPGVSQSIQEHPRVTQGSLVTKANFLMHWQRCYGPIHDRWSPAHWQKSYGPILLEWYMCSR